MTHGLERRILKLEQRMMPQDCICGRRPYHLRYFDHRGKELPNLGKGAPPYFCCPMHGEVGPMVRAIQLIAAGPNGDIAPGHVEVVINA